jgi:hypothetical protein
MPPWAGRGQHGRGPAYWAAAGPSTGAFGVRIHPRLPGLVTRPCAFAASSTGGVQDVTVTGSGRYVRVYGTQRATQYGYSLREFQVYGV